jgi:hypothetical protein
MAGALRQLAGGEPSAAADGLAALEADLWRVGGSDAQREIIEETRIAALLRAGRYVEARDVLDRRLDRRHATRDQGWRRVALRQAQGAVEQAQGAVGS